MSVTLPGSSPTHCGAAQPELTWSFRLVCTTEWHAVALLPWCQCAAPLYDVNAGCLVWRVADSDTMWPLDILPQVWRPWHVVYYERQYVSPTANCIRQHHYMHSCSA